MYLFRMRDRVKTNVNELRHLFVCHCQRNCKYNDRSEKKRNCIRATMEYESEFSIIWHYLFNWVKTIFLKIYLYVIFISAFCKIQMG